jgi:iron-regulated transporter 1
MSSRQSSSLLLPFPRILLLRQYSNSLFLYVPVLILTYLSGILLTLCVLLSASLLGAWVDRAPSRLSTLVATISVNRASVIAACIVWLLILTLPARVSRHLAPPEPTAYHWQTVTWDPRTALFVVVLLLSISERLSRIANLLSIERDWVPAMSVPVAALKEGAPPPKHGLTDMNAVMSRIDLVCKLLGPIALSAFTSAVGDLRLVVVTVLFLNAAFWPVEICSARRVYRLNAGLKEPKTRVTDESTSRGIAQWFRNYRDNILIYFAYPVWLPSIALAILNFSVLNYGPTLTVYLLNSHFKLSFITAGKALSAIAELASTFLTPWLVRFIGRGQRGQTRADRPATYTYDGATEEDPLLRGLTKRVLIHETDTAVALLGFWSTIQMFLCLIPACLALWAPSFSPSNSLSILITSTLITSTLLAFIPLSRFGRRTNHLTTTQLTQTLVPPSHRAAFAGAEQCFVSAFALGHWLATAACSRLGDFRWLALGSVGATGVSVVVYFGWLTRQGVAKGPRAERQRA